MRLPKVLVFACFLAFISLPVLAQESISFANFDGMFTGSGMGAGNTLSLANSELIGVSGFTGGQSGYDGTGNLGTLSFITGGLLSTTGCAIPPCTTTMVPLTGERSTFGATSGQTFNVTDTANGGFTFTGNFSKEHFFCVTGCTKTSQNAWSGTWQFNGLITNAQLVIGGQSYQVMGAVTYQGTPFNGSITRTCPTCSLSFKDTGGTTNFNISPEPGALTLFGSGLIALGLLTKFGRSRKPIGSTSVDW